MYLFFFFLPLNQNNKTKIMFKKESPLYSIAFNKCPKCHEGNFFESNNPYSFSKGTKMNKSCNCCGQSYDPEPFFYTGAMYVSYGITVMITAMVFIFTNILTEELPSILNFAIIEIIALAVMIPITFRLARIIWINIFVHYKKQEV